MMKVTFNADRQVLDHSGDVVDEFKAGKTYNLKWASARRWIRRGVAVEATTGKPAAKAKAKGASDDAATGGKAAADPVESKPPLDG